MNSAYVLSKQDRSEIDFTSSADIQATLAKSISMIVATSSTAQTVKGLFTAGVVKSARYVSEKLKKAQVKT